MGNIQLYLDFNLRVRAYSNVKVAKSSTANSRNLKTFKYLANNLMTINKTKTKAY